MKASNEPEDSGNDKTKDKPSFNLNQLSLAFIINKTI
jgi:hypothetical protein